MVKFWPWRGDASAADFEKTLSTLATRIQNTSQSNDRLRQRSRKVKVMWTLYTSFAYILVAVILTLVVGWQQWGVVEYGTVLGGPVVIYGVRKALTAYYDYRIANTTSYLETLQKERDTTIEKLKEATKYNSTQQLLDKYGGAGNKKQQQQQGQPPTPGSGRRKGGPQQDGGTSPQQHNIQRTGIAPPPTANIRRSLGGPGGPHGLPPNAPSTPPPHLTGPPPHPDANTPSSLTEEFAPNAFAAPPLTSGPPPSQSYLDPTTGPTSPHWYDRILDALMGEDETQAKNRIVLLCSQCRLVNGQAPPGVKRVEDIGRWRCGGCGAWNGVEREEVRVLGELRRVVDQGGEGEGGSRPVSRREDADVVGQGREGEAQKEKDEEDEEDEDGEPEEEMQETPPAGSTRSKKKNAKNRKGYAWNKEML